MARGNGCSTVFALLTGWMFRSTTLPVLPKRRQRRNAALPHRRWSHVPAFVILLTAALCGGHRASAAVPSQRVGVPTPAAPKVKAGELLVKFRPEIRPPAASLHQSRQAFAPYTGSTHLDALHQRYRVQSIEPLFTPPQAAIGAGRMKSDASASAWVDHVEGVRQRFPARARRAAAHQQMPDLSTIYKLTVPQDTDLTTLAAEYAADPAVEYAEPNYEYELHFIPNDPYFSSSGTWGQKFADLWGLHNIGAEAAWDLSTGAGVVVAVLDTGLEFHRDIRDNLWTNPGEIPNNGIDDDGNGFIDDVNGFWILYGYRNGQPTGGADHMGHGTHVSGTIAAIGNNSQEVVGVAWQAKVMTCGIFDGVGGATSYEIAEALAYAVDNGADVVNMSFGGAGKSRLVQDALDSAAAHGLVLVASAGNDAWDVNSTFPANFDSVIAVSAVDHLDRPSWFSNFGGKIELAAPGGGDPAPPISFPVASVLSLGASCTQVGVNNCFGDQRLALPGYEKLARLAGTSMAAPHVTGAAALILSRHPEFTVEQVRQALRDPADDLGPPGRDARYGYGRLNLSRAGARDTVGVARLHAPRHLRRTHGGILTVEATVQNPGGEQPTWRLLLGLQGETREEIAGGAGEVEHGVLATVDAAPLARGNYSLRLEVSAAGALIASDEAVFTRLASRPYLRQISDRGPVFGGQIQVHSKAWSGDGTTLVWSDMPSLSAERFVVTNVRDETDEVAAEFRFYADGSLLNPIKANEDVVISDDGKTVVFSDADNWDPENYLEEVQYQLSLLDRDTNQVRRLTNATDGSGWGNFNDLGISADGSLVTFTSDLDLDPTVGNPGGVGQLFYWDRGTSAFHQLTTFSSYTSTLHQPVLSTDGGRIAAISNADLDHSGGNDADQWWPFVYDLQGASFRKLNVAPLPFEPRRVNGPVAISADGSRVAVTLTALALSDLPAKIVVVNIADDSVERVLTLPAEGRHVFSLLFSPDGTRLLFAAQVAPDPWISGSYQNGGIFEYNLASAEVRALTTLNLNNGSFAVAADGRLALGAGQFDPDGVNSDGSFEVNVADPSNGGGLLILKDGRLGQGDQFKLNGFLVQPSASAFDPATSGLSLTLLGANGQLVRVVIPPGAMQANHTGWKYRSRDGALAKLNVRKLDATHYKFSAAGSRPGLFAVATSYLTVEIEVGTATFSNAEAFRSDQRSLNYRR